MGFGGMGAGRRFGAMGIPLGSAGSLGPFTSGVTAANTSNFRTVYQAGARNVRMAFIGDSTTRGQSFGVGTAQAINAWPMQLATVLNSAGIITGGNNVWGDGGSWGQAQTFANYLTGDARSSGTGAWALTGTNAPGGNAFFSSAAGSMTFTPQGNFDTVEVYWRDGASGRNFTIQIGADSAVAVNSTGSTVLARTVVTKTGGTVGSYPIVLTWALGNITPIGISAYDSSRKEITCWNWSICGGTSASLINNSDTAVGRLTCISNALTKPDIAFVEGGLINDWRTSVASGTSYTNLTTLVQALKAASCDVILCVPVFDNGSSGLTASQQTYVDVMYQVARENSVGVLDIRRKWQSYANAVANGWQTNSDNVHPTTAGYLDMATVAAAVIQQVIAGAPAYVGPVASRAYFADSKAATSGGWNSRTSHYALDTISALKLIFVNAYVIGGTGETVSGAVSTTTASIEYPAGTFTQVTFNGGSTSAAIASGATQISDFATVSIPKGAQFWIRRFQQTTQLVFSNKNNGHTMNLSLGDAVNNINTDFTMSGSVVDSGGGSMIPVQGILGMTRLPTIGVLGSSRTAGKLDTTLDATGLYGYARMYSGTFGTLDYAITGDKSTVVSTSAANIRKGLINTYCSHLWFDPGLNDINGSPGTAFAVLTALDTVATAFPGGKARTIVNNEGPWTTTTDAWATSANQTPFANEAQRVLLNTSIAALTGYNQIVDVASFMSNGTNGSLWNNPAVGGSQYTTDGIHEISAPLVALAAAGRFNLISR